MRNSEDKMVKTNSLGHIVKVQQVMDFMVLTELRHGRRYGKQLDLMITKSLGGVGVNDSYLAQRLKVLAEKGHVKSQWESDNRFNRFYEITDSGNEYLEQLKRDLPERVEIALKVYKRFEAFMNQP